LGARRVILRQVAGSTSTLNCSSRSPVGFASAQSRGLPHRDTATPSAADAPLRVILKNFPSALSNCYALGLADRHAKLRHGEILPHKWDYVIGDQPADGSLAVVIYGCICIKIQ
jgi:hypothetical protein